ncbi:helix-turn-helix domain-containing protein [Roseibium sp.]|uniref:helix-turn-helix domain-containing protein n=1 Tax=Roseibium sp. TaxID=1936156 RepID=UPI003B5081C6
MDADFGNVKFLMETGSRTYELELEAPQQFFGFSVILEQTKPMIVLGNEMRMDQVCVVPPHSVEHSVIPEKALFALLLVEHEALLSHPDLSPEATDWLMGLECSNGFINSPWLANRLREDMRCCLDCLLNVKTAEEKASLDTTMLGCIVAALSMEFLKRRTENTNRRPKHFETFWSVRAAIQLIEGKLPEPQTLLGPGLSMSRRTVETMFSNMVGLPPVKYHQIYRLNRARQKIRNLMHTNDSIGDIAAEEGFWDWSRFSSYYRRQFGERPSETRRKFSFPDEPARRR